MYCPDCKCPLFDDDRFCSGCGRRLENAETYCYQLEEEYRQPNNIRENELSYLNNAYNYFIKKLDSYLLYENLLSESQNIVYPKAINFYGGGLFIAYLLFFAASILLDIIIPTLLLIILFIIPFGIILPRNYYNRKLTKVRSHEEDLNQQIKNVDGELYQYYEKSNYKEVAFKYSNPFIMSKLIYLIQNRRADNIKEAINTMLDDKHKMNVANLQREIAKNAREAAEANKLVAIISGANYIEKHLGE